MNIDAMNGEALKIWNALKPMIDAEIDSRMGACVRRKKMQVTTAYSNGKIGVSEPYGEEITLPCRTAAQSSPVGSGVWVEYTQNLSTGVVVAPGDGVF